MVHFYAVYGCCLAIGVQSAAVNVVCELARKNPKNYLSLAPVFFKLMTTSTNNWMLIKIIKLVSALICSSFLEL
jgi:AP-3 complex subunit delta-1